MNYSKRVIGGGKEGKWGGLKIGAWWEWVQERTEESGGYRVHQEVAESIRKILGSLQKVRNCVREERGVLRK